MLILTSAFDVLFIERYYVLCGVLATIVWCEASTILVYIIQIKHIMTMIMTVTMCSNNNDNSCSVKCIFHGPIMLVYSHVTDQKSQYEI